MLALLNSDDEEEGIPSSWFLWGKSRTNISDRTFDDDDDDDDEDEQPVRPPQRRPMRYTNVGKLQMTILKGNIVQECSDVIVNSAVKNLDLKKGRASKALLDAAGDDIQSECDNNYRNGIQHGELAVTGGGKLSCQDIYHVCLPRWTGQAEEQILKTVIKKCLEKAHVRHRTSITFPALGTGFLGYSADTVAREMLQGLQDFDKAHSSTTLKIVTIVVFHQDRQTFQGFLSVARSFSKTGAMSPTKPKSVDSAATGHSSSKSTIGPVSFEVVYGKMDQQKVDVIVNSTSPNLKLDKGSGLAKSLLMAAGANLQKECDDTYPNGITPGQLAITGGYNLSCKKVYHGTFRSFYSKQLQNQQPEQVLYKFIQACLKEADKMGYVSIAFPALGTGFLKYPKDTVAGTFISSIRDFVNNNRTCVKQVTVVVFGPEWKDIEQAFTDELQGKQRPQKPATVTSQAATVPPRNTKAYLKYKYMESAHPPPYWTRFTEKKTVKDWSMHKTDPVLVPVDPQTYKSVASAFQNTGMGNRTIVSIQRVESIHLLEDYLHLCQSLFRQAFVEGQFKALDKVTGSRGPVVTLKHLSVSMTQHLSPEINEVYLFHGTKSNVVNTITHQGLDNRLAGAGRLGCGVYAAELASKSSQYVGASGSGQKFMFLVRMCLGDICITKSGQSYKRPPCKKCGVGVCSTHTECYNSVVADGGSFDNREFVVYDQDQTYPEYLITYT